MSATREHFVSNQDVSVRMFRSDFMEWFSHVHPAVPHVIYVPLVAGLLWNAPTTAAQSALIFVAGLLLWTLAEYVLHKHVFHAPDDVMAETHAVVVSLRGTDTPLRIWVVRPPGSAIAVQVDPPLVVR